MSMRLLIRLLAVVALCAAAVYGASLYLRPVAIVTPVVRDTAVNAVPATLTVMVKTRELRSEIGGRIAEEKLEVGRPVTAGEVLVQLDTAAVVLEIENIESRIGSTRERVRIGPLTAADLENARALLAIREAELKRGQKPQVEVDAQKRVVDGLVRRVDLEKVNLAQELAALENELKVKTDQRGRMTLRSPIDGVISRINARTGDLIGGGQTVAEIIPHTRTVEGQVAESFFAGIRPGQIATVRLANWGEEKFDAKVSKVLPASDPQTQRYLVEFDVQIALERLVPGMTGEALVIIDQRPNAMIVPRPAVVGKRVYVVAGGRVDVRPVETGYASYSDVEILSGLRDGELVIVDSLDLFRPGQRVETKVRPPSTARRGSESGK